MTILMSEPNTYSNSELNSGTLLLKRQRQINIIDDQFSFSGLVALDPYINKCLLM